MVAKKIGLAGKSGSGKDVVADYISDRYGYKKRAVADAIRIEVADHLWEILGPIGMPDSVMAEVVSMVYEKPTPHAIRVLLQYWGTEYRCAQDPNYWVDQLSSRLAKDDYVVVSDVRLLVELDAIHSAGGEVWFVERPGVPPVGIPDHLTEIGLDGAIFDRIIQNDQSLADLKNKVDFIFREC